MIRLACLILALLSGFWSFAQSTYEHGIPFYPIPIKDQRYIDVQYIELNQNNFLHRQIAKYIQEQADSSELFKAGFGFITVDNITIASSKPYFLKKEENGIHVEDLKFKLGTRSFLLTPSFETVSSYCTGCFPDFYSLIDDRLVFFYSDQSRWLHQGYFSEDSKKRLITIQRKHLQQALDPNFAFIDLFGKPFKISAEERQRLTEDEILLKASLTLQASKIVVQYLDGQIKYQY